MKKYVNELNLSKEEMKAAEYPGVSYRKRDNTWIARARYQGKQKHIGRYPNPISARAAIIDFYDQNSNVADRPEISSYKQIVKDHPVAASGHRGVRLSYGKWEANITFRGLRTYLGTYDDIADAIKARKKAEELYFEPFIKDFEEKCPWFKCEHTRNDSPLY